MLVHKKKDRFPLAVAFALPRSTEITDSYYTTAGVCFRKAAKYVSACSGPKRIFTGIPLEGLAHEVRRHSLLTILHMPNKQHSIMLTPRTVRKGVRSAEKDGSLSRLKQVQVRRIIQGDDSDSGGEEERLNALLEQRVRGAAAVSPSPPSPSDGPDAWRLACETAEYVIRGADDPRGEPHASPEHNNTMSPGASPESVTPMALSVLHEWGTGLTITGSCIRNSAAALESTALSPHTTTSTTALSPRKTHDQQYGVEPRTTSTVLSPRKSTASAVKQWLRADDANEPCADRSKPRAGMAGGRPGKPKSSVGALLLQDTWGRFCVQALVPGRLALLIVGDAGCMSARLSSHSSLKI